jgi:paraquat-inducible protein A
MPRPPRPLSLVCPHCGQSHHLPALAPGERAQCVRCDTTLARGARFGGESALAFAVTGLCLAVPASLLPFVAVSKLHAERVSTAFSGVRALWEAGMHLLAVWVFLCGLLVPYLLLGSLTGLLLLLRSRAEPAGGVSRALLRIVRAFEHWSLPEVHILAVLVAFAKLGSLVHVNPGPGLWCYAGMAACLLAAWTTFEHHHLPRLGLHEESQPAVELPP